MKDNLEGTLDVWGGGQLLAFSAVEGPTEFEQQLVARTAFDHVGLDVKLPGECRLRFGQGRPQSTVIGGDFFELRVGEALVRGAFLDTYHLLIEGPCEVVGEASPALALLRTPGMTLVAPAGKIDRAKIGTGLAGAIRSRKNWLQSLQLPPNLSDRLRRLLVKAMSVMKTQVYSPQGRIRRRWTTADRWPHRRMFLWDSVFHAMGWRHVDVATAREAIHALLDVQQGDGMIAHTHDIGFSSRFTQPPVLAMGTIMVDAVSPDDAWLAQMYEGLCRYIEWDLAHCDTDGAGLLEWRITNEATCRCDESGMDNSPRFDCAVHLDSPDFNSFVAHECEMLAKIARRLGKKAAAAKWQAVRDRLCELINQRLWNEDLGFYVDAVAATGKQTNILASSGFLPLMCGAPSQAQAKRLAKHLHNPQTFGTPLPVPTLAGGTHPDLYSKDMWRGPVWMNYNWLVAYGLDRYGLKEEAAMIREKSLSAVSRYYEDLGCLFEFYDDQLQVPPPELYRKRQRVFDKHPHMVIHDYGWTATCCADWILSGS